MIHLISETSKCADTPNMSTVASHSTEQGADVTFLYRKRLVLASAFNNSVESTCMHENSTVTNQ